MKNTGEKSQDLFHDAIKSLGKKTHIYRLTDTKEVKGGNKEALAKATPSDFIVGGAMFSPMLFYAEVKSCSNETSFPFSSFRPAQRIAMAELRISEAWDCYKVFVHNLLTDRWYELDAHVIYRQDKKSMKWHEMKPCLWLEELIKGKNK